MAEAPIARRSTAVDGSGTAALSGLAEAMTHSSHSRPGGRDTRQPQAAPGDLPSRLIVDNLLPYTGSDSHTSPWGSSEVAIGRVAKPLGRDRHDARVSPTSGVLPG